MCPKILFFWKHQFIFFEVKNRYFFSFELKTLKFFPGSNWLILITVKESLSNFEESTHMRQGGLNPHISRERCQVKHYFSAFNLCEILSIHGSFTSEKILKEVPTYTFDVGLQPLFPMSLFFILPSFPLFKCKRLDQLIIAGFGGKNCAHSYLSLSSARAFHISPWTH